MPAKLTALRILAVVLVVWLLINMVLFALGKISILLFWSTIVIFAIVAYKGFPLLKGRKT